MLLAAANALVNTDAPSLLHIIRPAPHHHFFTDECFPDALQLLSRKGHLPLGMLEEKNDYAQVFPMYM
jgi:hypothetical protein